MSDTSMMQRPPSAEPDLLEDVIFPPSFAQQRLWFIHQLQPGTSAYNVPMVTRLSGALDTAALELAIQTIQSRHETLRTTFTIIDGEPVQVISPEVTVTLPVTDLTHLPAERREPEARRLATEAVDQPFDLERGPMLRAQLLRLAADDHVLVVAANHIAADGWSLGLFHQELGALYAAFREGRASPLADLPVQYADFSVWQREWLQGPQLGKQVAYWRRKLEGLSTLDLVTDRPRPAQMTSSGALQSIQLDESLSGALNALAQRRGCSLFMVVLAGFNALLHRYTGQDDIVVGAPTAGRNRAEIEGLIGFFVNNLVLRTDCAGDPSFTELLARVRETTLEAYAHEDLPFEKLVEELEPERDPSRNPLFQVTFAVQNAPMEPMALAGLTVGSFSTSGMKTRSDLEVHVFAAGTALNVLFVYNTDLFDAATVNRMADSYRNLLEAVVASPEQRLSQLPLQTAAERHRVLVEWNRTDASYPQSCLHELIEAAVARTPDAIAVVARGGSYTYRELNDRANRLARHLQTLGVGPDTLVGICAGRSPHTVVGLLAILKAGGAYVPLDSGHPKDRLAFMLADTGVGVLLTEAGLLPSLPADLLRHVVMLDRELPGPGNDGAGNPVSGATPDNLAYVLYTSGSTGQPKGTLVNHRGVVNYLSWGIAAYEVAAGTGAPVHSPLTFDLTVTSLFMPLVAGRTVELVPEETGVEALAMALRARANYSLVKLTPAHLELLSQQVPPSAAAGLTRALIIGGENLLWESIAFWQDHAPGTVLVNEYGPTETVVGCCVYRIPDGERGSGAVPIGRPIANTRLYVLDRYRQPAPIGVPGELYIGGAGVARGYLNRPGLTAERFVPDPFNPTPGSLLYRSGDRVRYRPDGTLEFLGRFDEQVKIRGYRIEPGEIEALLLHHPAIREAVVVVREDAPGDRRLVAYLVAESSAAAGSVGPPEWRVHLGRQLPEYMVPSAFVALESLPLTPNGKVDRRALPAPATHQAEGHSLLPPRNELEEAIARVWREVLRVNVIGIRDNFFEAGGHSLLLIKLHSRLTAELECELSIVELFAHPTIESLARKLGGEEAGLTPSEAANARAARRRVSSAGEAIAVVGMAGRFPGADDLDAFWSLLAEGREGIRSFSDDELRAAGVAEPLLQYPGYVKARGVLNGAELFDAGFFGYSPREAEVTDPQQRIFLECAWEALEHAGFDPERYQGSIGMFAGASKNGYLTGRETHPSVQALGGMHAMLGGDRDFLPTRVSYELNLQGPSVNIQTACSTSLVAVHAACQSLLHGECDLALAGGVSVAVSEVQGSLYQDGGILSPDGRCRTFDADARGTVGGSGVGIVVLQRLSEAVRDGAVIHAVIRGTAVNNDGSAKVGFSAPSVPGQAAVIAQAHAAAGVAASSISYVEAHGTATALGDPIEVEALTRAFGQGGAPGRCALGSVKSNVGHLDAAAGVAGLIKTVLCLKHGELVPSLHFQRPNPAIRFAGGPFVVNTVRQPWRTPAGEMRLAGVSSFGIGGTNAHAVVEEAPAPAASGPSRPWQALLLSAKTAGALDAASARLAAHLRAHPDVPLADVACTLQVGRREFEQRRVVVAQSAADAVEALEGRASARLWSAKTLPTHRGIVFMFPGQGSQYPGMGRELYDSEPVFRAVVDECADRARADLGYDIREAMYPAAGPGEAASGRLRQTLAAQVSLFAVELGLARLWMSWGVKPAACIGHSIGEYVAACLAEVLSLEDALGLVLLRGRLMDQAPAGAMLAVPLAEEQLGAWMGEGLWLSAVNGRASCVVSGLPQQIEQLDQRLRTGGVEGKRLNTAGAFHSGLMSAGMEPLTDAVRRLRVSRPKIPYISNVTGSWMNREVHDPAYWSRHLCEPVRFHEGVAELLSFGTRVFLEVGPGHALSTLVRRQAATDGPADVLAIPSLRHASESAADSETMARALGRVWSTGLTPDWAAYYGAERRRRVELPTYPFQRERYWLEPESHAAPTIAATGKRPDVADWFYLPIWRESPPRQPLAADAHPGARTWLVFADEVGVGGAIADRLEAAGHEVIRVTAGARFVAERPGHYQLDPGVPEHYRSLAQALAGRERAPSHVVHAWGVTGGPVAAASEPALRLGFYSVLQLLQSLQLGSRSESLTATVITDQMQQVTGREVLSSAKAAVLGVCRVAPQEYPNLACASVDLDWPSLESERRDTLDRLMDELLSPSTDTTVAYRGNVRWVQDFEPMRLPSITPEAARLRRNGVYLITGGLGSVGFALAGYLAQVVQARLVLTGRTGLPEPAQWTRWLETHQDTDATSLRILRAQALERLGAEVLVVQADVADADRMREVLAQAETRFGAVHGVIHAAGNVSRDTFKLVERLTPSDCERQFAPKLHGTVALSEALGARSLDFCLLTSSISTVLGGLEYTAYVAANCVENSLAQREARQGGSPWISVDWDSWQPDGTASDDAAATRGAARFAMTSAEGAEAFLRILALRRVNRVVVSTGDLTARRNPPPRSAVAPTAAAPAASKSHPRPDVATRFVAPRDDVESAIARLWQDILGISGIGVEDDFFELGGDSLIAVQLMFRLSTALGVELGTQMLFKAPTVGELAQAIRQAKERQQVDAAKIGQLHAMVENMSDEEVRRLLGEDYPGKGGIGP